MILNLSIVSCCYHIVSSLLCFRCEEVEFYQIVTPDIRIGCMSFWISIIDKRHDTVIVFLDVVESVEWYREMCGNGLCYFQIRSGCTIWTVAKVVDHKSGMYLMSLFLEECCDHTGIHSSWECYEYFHIFISWCIFTINSSQESTRILGSREWFLFQGVFRQYAWISCLKYSSILCHPSSSAWVIPRFFA